jgi:hypothetical protein
MRQAGSAVLCLDDLLKSGQLEPSVDQYLAEMRNGNRSFYAVVFKEKGYEAAELELKQWARRHHMHEFAQSIEQIAVGMRDFAQADLEDKYVRITAANRNLSFPPIRSFGHDATMIAVLDLPRHKGCGCNQPEGAEIFGEYGTLPLKAAILGVASRTHDHRLVLVFPARETVPQNSDGYTTLIIERSGHTDGVTCFPRLQEGSHLAYSLGLTTADRVFGAMTCAGGSLDQRFGFPGAGEYLVKHLSKLGPYLSAISQAMGKAHC